MANKWIDRLEYWASMLLEAVEEYPSEMRERILVMFCGVSDSFSLYSSPSPPAFYQDNLRLVKDVDFIQIGRDTFFLSDSARGQ